MNMVANKAAFLATSASFDQLPVAMEKPAAVWPPVMAQRTRLSLCVATGRQSRPLRGQAPMRRM